MSANTGWPIRGYWIKFNPKTHMGTIWLNMNDSSQPEVTLNNLSPEETSAIAAILASGRAHLMSDGTIITQS
jgi:hypothetical protein